MKILVVSAGAVGAFFTSRLAEAGHSVAATVRSDYERVLRNGFEIHSEAFGDYIFRPDGVYRSAEEYPETPDCVIVTSKVLPGIDVPAMIRPAVRSRKTAILLIQNGIGIEKAVAEAFPENEILSAVAYIGATRTAPGSVTQKGAKKLMIGKYPEGKSEFGPRLAEAFRAGGVEAEYTEKIGYFRWKKLLWNTPYNAVSVLGGGLDTKQMSDHGPVEKLCRTIMEEVAKVAEAEGFVFPPETILENLEFTRNFPAYKTSMLVDYEAGRRLESDAIVGSVRRIAEKHGIRIPYTEACGILLDAIAAKRK